MIRLLTGGMLFSQNSEVPRVFFLGVWGFPKMVVPCGTPKWRVFIMENPIKVDDLEVPLFFGNPEVGTDLSYF